MTTQHNRGEDGSVCWLPCELKERTQLSCLRWPGKAHLENMTFEPVLKVN